MKEYTNSKESVSRPEDALFVSGGLSYSAMELSAIFSNLAKGCEKQYDPQSAELYRELSSYYLNRAEPAVKADLGVLQAQVLEDLDSLFASANEAAREKGDRGALRALKWSEQVSRIVKSLLRRAESGNADFLEDKNVYVCDICGFIFVGDERPEICPVCKVPGFKMTQVQREA